MSEKGKVRRVFPGGNTTEGYLSFYDYIIEPDAARIFVIKGGPGVGKSTFMKRIANEMLNRGYDVEFHHCSSDKESLDGIMIPDLRVALIDGTAPHLVDPKNPGVVGEIVYLGDYWNENKIIRFKSEIIKTNKCIGNFFKTAYSLLREAKVAYDEWKSYVEESMDRDKYYKILKELLDDVFMVTASSSPGCFKSRHLLASAITPEGSWNYIDTLIDNDMRVYALKGEPGSGLKKAIARVAQAAEEAGLFTEQFHCPFEPDCLDMVYIPDIKTAVINVSEPFHYSIEGLASMTVRMELDFRECLQKDILKEYEEEMKEAKGRVLALINKAVFYIARAKAAHDELEGYYIPSMDFNKIQMKTNQVLEKILSYSKR